MWFLCHITLSILWFEHRKVHWLCNLKDNKGVKNSNFSSLINSFFQWTWKNVFGYLFLIQWEWTAHVSFDLTLFCFLPELPALSNLNLNRCNLSDDGCEKFSCKLLRHDYYSQTVIVYILIKICLLPSILQGWEIWKY